LNYCQKGAELQPSTPLVNVQIANLLFLMNRTDEAVNLLKLESQNESQKYPALGSLAHIYARTGNRDEAEKIYLELKAAPDSADKFGDLTLVGFTLGKKDEALKSFGQMFEISAIKPKYIVFDPFWEEIFKDEDFRRVLAQN
jgi:tetratricopeptide (TPR) repeat protein